MAPVVGHAVATSAQPSVVAVPLSIVTPEYTFGPTDDLQSEQVLLDMDSGGENQLFLPYGEEDVDDFFALDSTEDVSLDVDKLNSN
ncbi:hypothetical protein A0H81_03602 [Grifola frondosa]|uniref:Uncharacterized protein n=1 Tax=Grifola frondosa TaxID=5627 RepID=A0A1C7MHK6_GRIFR|nr:hypothetical protein A0H81_03602 [Grifola frondosa]